MILLLFFGGIHFFYTRIEQMDYENREVSEGELEKFLKDKSPVIVDLREYREVLRQPIIYHPLIHLPFLTIQHNPEKITFDSSQNYLLVCNDGNRARLIAFQVSKKKNAIYYLKEGLWGIPDNLKKNLLK